MSLAPQVNKVIFAEKSGWENLYQEPNQLTHNADKNVDIG